MSAVFILESQPLVGPLVKGLLGASSRQVVSMQSVPDAKRRLVSEPPAVVLFAMDAVAEAFNFASGLRDHPVLCAIPVIVCAAIVDAALTEQGKASGAAAVVPPDAEALKRALAEFIPELRDPVVEPAESRVSAPEALVTPSVPAASREELFQIAQKLLAQVLHNLKTSNLLDVASTEDVPRIVSEITRKVCDSAIRGRQPKPAKEAPDAVDLGSVFSKKS